MEFGVILGPLVVLVSAATGFYYGTKGQLTAAQQVEIPVAKPSLLRLTSPRGGGLGVRHGCRHDPQRQRCGGDGGTNLWQPHRTRAIPSLLERPALADPQPLTTAERFLNQLRQHAPTTQG